MSDLMISRSSAARLFDFRGMAFDPMAALRLMVRTYATRRELTQLSPRELADVGIPANAALREAARLPWDTTSGPRRQDNGSILLRIQNAIERARTRRLITQMQARELRDIGLSPTDAQAEASKPFWLA